MSPSRIFLWYTPIVPAVGRWRQSSVRLSTNKLTNLEAGVATLAIPAVGKWQQAVHEFEARSQIIPGRRKPMTPICVYV